LGGHKTKNKTQELIIFVSNDFLIFRYITRGITCMPVSDLPELARALPVTHFIYLQNMSRKGRDKGFVRLMPLLANCKRDL